MAVESEGKVGSFLRNGWRVGLLSQKQSVERD